MAGTIFWRDPLTWGRYMEEVIRRQDFMVDCLHIDEVVWTGWWQLGIDSSGIDSSDVVQSGHKSLFDFDGILPKGPYLPCLCMADRALLAGYPRCMFDRSHGSTLWHIISYRTTLCRHPNVPVILTKILTRDTWYLTCPCERLFFPEIKFWSIYSNLLNSLAPGRCSCNCNLVIFKIISVIDISSISC